MSKLTREGLIDEVMLAMNSAIAKAHQEYPYRKKRIEQAKEQILSILQSHEPDKPELRGLTIEEICQKYPGQVAKVLRKMRKPKVSKAEWKKFSQEYDGEMPDDYYRGAECVFEWLKIIGVEAEDKKEAGK